MITKRCERYDCRNTASFSCTYDRRRIGLTRRGETTEFKRYLCAMHTDWLEQDGNVSNIRRARLL